MSSSNVTNMKAYKCFDCEISPGGYHLPGCSEALGAARRPGFLEQFDTELATITQRRGAVYGDPTDNFTKAADLMAMFDHVEPKALRHALRMVCVKLARLSQTPDHLGSYVDIAGYARTAAMVIEKAGGTQNNT